jgi:G:T/U-mismatch repair DNA glycosylase
MEIEQHPLEPFLPGNARLLMLGSFPPQRKRWSMEFYYPNWNNDMWRIAGLLFFNDKDHFADKSQKAFRKERIIDFLNEKGIARVFKAVGIGTKPKFDRYEYAVAW